MARGYTKAMRDAKDEAFMPHMVVENDRMYLVQRLVGGEVKVDATGLYFYLKEMFTTDWEERANDPTK